jgi:hypothetical protein
MQRSRPEEWGVVASLTQDQLTLLRIARRNGLPPGPCLRPQNCLQDLTLLFVLQLIERRGGFFQLTTLGAAYLERVDAESLAENWEEPPAARRDSHG